MLLANPTRTQLLESELASLAPRLSSLTVLMRTAVLPVMSLANPEAAKRLQVVYPLSMQYYCLPSLCAITKLYASSARSARRRTFNVDQQGCVDVPGLLHVGQTLQHAVCMTVCCIVHLT